MRRETFLERLRHTSYFDVIVIGGGATGLWCALDATLRGYKTLLVEQNDFAASASSKSTKLFHGGLRYLKQGHLGLVREALHERGYLAKMAPHLVTLRPFIIPHYAFIGKWWYGLGLSLYDLLAGRLACKYHSTLSREKTVEKSPNLNKNGLKNASLFYDGQFDDARFCIELAKKIAREGGCLLTYAKVTELLHQQEQITGVVIRDELGKELFQVHGKTIINATGVFTDKLRALDDRRCRPIMALSRGSHIVVDQKFLPGQTAIVVPKTADGRLIFIIPWLGKVLIGTTDIATYTPEIEPIPTSEEVDFLLKEAGNYLELKPKREDILSLFSGLRPLVRKSDQKKTAKLSRSHKILVSSSGMITITGGKWTTARKMAEECINQAIQEGFLEKRPCTTKNLHFEEGAQPHQGPLLHPSLPYTESDLVEAASEEMCSTLADLLARRTRCLFLNAKATLEIAPLAANILAKNLGKSPAWAAEELKKFQDFAKHYCV